jgi:NAD(P)-dependent dehydrogenase (short-subunit alcohol dehydrogenase family)
MDFFAGKLAVVTGGGSGMGRALVIQLAAEGCSVATCDVNAASAGETAALAQAGRPDGVLVTGHTCDVSDEAQVLRFRDELLAQHASEHVDLVFSNAGIGGGESFVASRREDWERTFATDWWGVYYCARAFLPLLIASGDGVLVNTSSVNGFWATLGPGIPNNAYSAAKFAVKGFSEALIEDLRAHAPQVRVAVVMPGHVGGPKARQLISCASCSCGRTPTSGTRRRSAPRRRRPSFSTGCGPGPGGSSSARTPRRSTGWCARGPRPPTTTPSWAEWQPRKRRRHHHLSRSQQNEWSAAAVTGMLPVQARPGRSTSWTSKS